MMGSRSFARIKVAVLALRSLRPCITSRVICETLLYLPCDVWNPALLDWLKHRETSWYPWIFRSDVQSRISCVAMWSYVAIN